MDTNLPSDLINANLASQLAGLCVRSPKEFIAKTGLQPAGSYRRGQNAQPLFSRGAVEAWMVNNLSESRQQKTFLPAAEPVAQPAVPQRPSSQDASIKALLTGLVEALMPTNPVSSATSLNDDVMRRLDVIDSTLTSDILPMLRKLTNEVTVLNQALGLMLVRPHQPQYEPLDMLRMVGPGLTPSPSIPVPGWTPGLVPYGTSQAETAQAAAAP